MCITINVSVQFHSHHLPKGWCKQTKRTKPTHFNLESSSEFGGSYPLPPVKKQTIQNIKLSPMLHAFPMQWTLVLTQRQWPIILIHRSSKVLMHCQSTFHLCHDGKGGNKFSCFTFFLLHISSCLLFESNLIRNNNPQRKLNSFGVFLPH